jgi:hypothetical protein
VKKKLIWSHSLIDQLCALSWQIVISLYVLSLRCDLSYREFEVSNYVSSRPIKEQFLHYVFEVSIYHLFLLLSLLNLILIQIIRL